MSDMPLFFPQTIYSNKKGPVPRVMIAACIQQCSIMTLWSWPLPTRIFSRIFCQKVSSTKMMSL